MKLVKKIATFLGIICVMGTIVLAAGNSNISKMTGTVARAVIKVTKKDRYKFEPNCMIYWSTQGCIPCRKMQPIIQELRQEGYIVYIFKWSDDPELAEQMGIEAFPTMIIFEKSKEVKRFTGIVDKDDILKYLKKNVVPKPLDYRIW